jgi:hypothetical protein
VSEKPLTLADLGDVITDAQLAALMQRAPSWPRRERDRAKQYRVRPNLPEPMVGFAHPRYTKRAVQKWLDEASAPMRVVRRGRVA